MKQHSVLLPFERLGAAVVSWGGEVGVAQQVEQHLDFDAVGLVGGVMDVITVPPATWGSVRTELRLEEDHAMEWRSSQRPSHEQTRWRTI